MTPEQREQWQQMRAKFMQEILPLRQALNAKQMELETLWEQQNPDPEKIKKLSNRITELRSKLDQKHDEMLTRCRQEFGDKGWACPGGHWRGY
jgi:Spy/CpxP family protein refolding chaperone